MKKLNSIDKLQELVQKAEQIPNNGFATTFREIKGVAQVIIKNELGIDNDHYKKLQTASYFVNYPGKKLKAILAVALEDLHYKKKSVKKAAIKKTIAKKTAVAKKPIETYCFNCQKETNQDVLFDEFELRTQEIIWRNEEGDETESAWTPVGNLWTISKCRGCEKLTFKHILRISPDRSTDNIFYFPRKPIREIPHWIMKLPEKYLGIFQEVYLAINEKLFRLALNGIRTILDLFIITKVGDKGTFKQKLEALVNKGIITASKASVLEAAIDAGNAAAHRSYKPDQDTLFKVMEIVENLLHSEIVDRHATHIKEKTPKRGTHTEGRAS